MVQQIVREKLNGRRITAFHTIKSMYDHNNLIVTTEQGPSYRLCVDEFMKIAPFLNFVAQKKITLTHLQIATLDVKDEGLAIRFPVK